MTHLNSSFTRTFSIGWAGTGVVEELKMRTQRYLPGIRPFARYVLPCLRFPHFVVSLWKSEEGIFFDQIQMGDKSREARLERLRQIAFMRQYQGAQSDWSAITGEADRAPGVLPTPPPLPDLRNPGLYLDFFGPTLDFAVSSRKSRHPLAIGSGINSESRAWEWICEQICVDAPDPAWLRRPFADQRGILFAQLFRKIGACRLPINIGPTAASQMSSRT